MNDYIAAFSPKIIGVTGEPEAVRAMLRDYGVIFRRVAARGRRLHDGPHRIGASCSTRTAAFVGTIDREEPRETAVAKLRRLVAG